MQLLVQTNVKNTYEMHRLVQLAMILWLKSQRKLADWQRKALMKLEDKFPVYSFELWPFAKFSILMHVWQSNINLRIQEPASYTPALLPRWQSMKLQDITWKWLMVG